MRALARQFLREHLLLGLGYALLLLVNLVAAILYWPEIRDRTSALLPLIPFEQIRGWLATVEQSGFWAWFAIQHLLKGAALFGMAAGALLGGGLIAREADIGTAELLLSRPVSRRRILLVRWTTGLAMLVLEHFLVSLAGILLAPVVGETLPLGPVLAGSLYASVFVAMIYAAATWLSAGASHQLRPGLLVLGLMLLQFALYLVEGVGRWTLLALVDPRVLVPLREGVFPWGRAAGMLAATLVFLGLALRRFERRDF